MKSGNQKGNSRALGAFAQKFLKTLVFGMQLKQD